MDKKLNFLIITGLLVILLLVAAMAYDYLSKDAAPENIATLSPTQAPDATGGQQPQAAPDFTVYDSDGNAHKLSDFRGKPVVLNFWASWCGPCKSEMPDFDEAYAQHGNNIHFLMVNLTDNYQETVDAASAFIEENGYGFPVYYDTDVDAAAAYGVSSVPVTYFIDGDGYLVAMGQGMLSAYDLARGIAMLTE